jgi:hypothetical protein
MRMLPRKESTAENTAQEAGTGTERRVLRRTEVTVERKFLSVLVPPRIEVNTEKAPVKESNRSRECKDEITNSPLTFFGGFPGDYSLRLGIRSWPVKQHDSSRRGPVGFPTGLIRPIQKRGKTRANNLWTAFIADNGSNEILAASLPEGETWTPSVSINETSRFTPSLALFGGKLYIACVTDDVDSATSVPSNRIFLCSITDGVSWSSATFFHQYSQYAPSLAVWNGKLHLAFVANDPSNGLLVYYSSTPDDRTSWSATVPVNQTTASAPSLAAYGPSGQTGELYLAFVAENGSNDIFVCSLAAGGTWSSAAVTGQSCHSSPSLATLGEALYLVFAAANGSKDLYLCSRNANGSWSAAVPVNQSTSATPCAGGSSSGLSVGFVANGSNGEVLVSSNSNPTTSWRAAMSTSNSRARRDYRSRSRLSPAAGCGSISGASRRLHAIRLLGRPRKR